MSSKHHDQALSNDDLVRMRDSVLAQIRRDFELVTREGGVSMSEAHAIDDYESDEARARARASDTDRHWSEIDINREDPGGSALSFMDPIGFRYHYPAYMTFSLNHGYHELGTFIDSNCQDRAVYHATPPASREDKWFDYLLNKFSLFDNPQRRCVARFLVFEIESHAADAISRESPLKALQRLWLQHLPSGEQAKLRDRWPQLRD